MKRLGYSVEEIITTAVKLAKLAAGDIDGIGENKVLNV